jgi:hypothetical protein
MKDYVKRLLLLVALLVAIPMSWAQTSNQGGMIGTITDPSGSVMPDVTVTVINSDTGVSRTVISNAQGDYRVDFLLPGAYQVNAEKQGFMKVTLTGLVVRVGESQRADLKMEVGAVTQNVTVSSTAVALNTESAAQGDVVTTSSIRELPLNGREFIQLATLVPGAEAGNPKKGINDLDKGDKGFQIGFNGARAAYNSFYIDGGSSTDPQYNTLVTSPSLDAIKEFQIETNMYSAQYGRSGGAVINIVTNSGTNKIHGTLFEFNRNKALDARPDFFTAPKSQEPGYLQNQWGGSIGGPIRKNKTFYFGSAEFFRNKKPGQLISTFTPTAAEAAGDLSQTTNWYTGKPVVLINPYTQQVIPSSIVPQDLMSPAGQKVMSLWAASGPPNYPEDPIANTRYFRGGTYKQNKALGRIDHQFSERNLLFGTFSYDDYDNVTPEYNKYADTDYLEHDKTLALTFTHTFTPTLVNDLKGSYTQYSAGTHFNLEDQNYGKLWGLWAGTENPINGSPRLIMTTGGVNYILGWGGFDNYTEKSTYLRDNIVWSKGKHNLVIGGDFLDQGFNWFVADALPVTMKFGIDDGVPSVAPTFGVSGSAFSDVLMGLASQHTYGSSTTRIPLSRKGFGVYVQDNWKVTPRLTLNPGLRYDYEPAFKATDNEYAVLDWKTGLPIYASGVPKDKMALVSFPYETNGKNYGFAPHNKEFGPRIALAFMPFKNNMKTVIRAGYGIYFASEDAWSTEYGAWVAPFRGEFFYSPNAYEWPDGQNHYVPMDQEPYGYDHALGATPGYANVPTPVYPGSYVNQWNISVGRDLGGGLEAELAYVGSKGTNLDSASSLAALAPALNAEVAELVPNWYVGVTSKGYNSIYNSLQAKLRKDMSHGLFFLSAYTWGHAKAEASDIVSNNLLVDTNLAGQVMSRAYPNADFDVRQRFTWSGGWNVPVGRGMAYGSNWNALANGILGGWTFNAIMTLQGGYPFTVDDTTGFLPDRICDGNLRAGRTPNEWFNYNCFVTHQPTSGISPTTGQPVLYGYQGNAAQNVIFGPGTNDWDVALHKQFPVREGMRFEFRGEFFNLFNHPGYIGPSSTTFTDNASGAELTRARDQRDIQFGLKFIF